MNPISNIQLQLVAEILCLATTEEIAAINEILGDTCGKVVTIVPTGV